MMSTIADELEAARRATLERFAQAWSARDVDGVLACMSVMCLYGASVGPEPGRTFRGKAEVHAGVLAMWAHDKTIRSEITNLRIYGDHAVWEWRYFRLDDAGRDVMDHGCDLITFVGDKMAEKQAFRKVRHV